MADKYVYAALLLHKCGQPISEENVTAVVLQALGCDPGLPGTDPEGFDRNRVKALVSSLEGVDVDEVLKRSVAAPVPQPSKPEAQEPAKKDEGKPDDLGLGKLFGD